MTVGVDTDWYALVQDSRDQWVWPCPAPPLSDNSWYDDTLPTDVVDVQIDQHLSQAAGTGALQLGVHVFRRVPSIGFQLLGASLLCASFMGTAVGMQSAQAPMLVYVWRSQLALMLCVPWLCTTVYYHRGAIDALWEPRMLLSITLAGASRATPAVLHVVKSRMRRATSAVLRVVKSRVRRATSAVLRVDMSCVPSAVHVFKSCMRRAVSAVDMWLLSVVDSRVRCATSAVLHTCGQVSRETRNFCCTKCGQVSRETCNVCCIICGQLWRCIQMTLHSLAPPGIGDDPVSYLAVQRVPVALLY